MVGGETMLSQTLPLGGAQKGPPAGKSPAETLTDAAGISDVGQRRSANEDTYLVAAFQQSMSVLDSSAEGKHTGWSSGQVVGTVLMVADGMGGHGGGDIASQSAVDAIANYLVNVVPCATSLLESLPDGARSSLHDLRGKLSSALLVGDEAIRERSQTSSAHNMGTTLTLAFVTWPALYVAHVGDSRCYLVRDGQLIQLTNDHTVANQIAKLHGTNVDESTQLNHILWNCLGGGDEARPTPEVLKVQLLPRDAVFLCTDGLTNELTEAQIAEELNRSGTSKEICRRLVDLANSAGGKDNITAVLLQPTSP
jgi:protein phosphatase